MYMTKYTDYTTFHRQITNTISSLLEYLESSDYKGYEAYDVLTEFIGRRIRPAVLGAVLTQLIRVSPIPLQKIYKKPKLYTKSMSLIAHSYLILYKILGDTTFRDKALNCLKWLIEQKSPLSKNFSLGSTYNLSMKSYGSDAATPSPLITAFAVEAMMTAYTVLNDDLYLDYAESGIHYFIDELPIVTVDERHSYFTYHPKNPHFIPNLPAVLCGTLARFYAIKHDDSLRDIMAANLRQVVNHQLSDGSWPYQPGSSYIDSFHTGFVLEGLAKYQFYTRNMEFNQFFGKGLSFYLKTFFGSDGKPSHKKLIGIPANADSLLTKLDLRDCAQAFVLFNLLVKEANFPINLAADLFTWCYNNFRSPKGYFYYQATPFYTIRSPFIAMQGWMLFGLTNLLESIHTFQQTQRTAQTS